MRQWRLWRRWVLANSTGELIGLGSTFAIGVGLFSGLGDAPGIGPALLSAAVMTLTGVLEGVIVGLAQWFVLRNAITSITRRIWVIATIIGGILAWFLGSIPMTMASLASETTTTPVDEPPLAIMLLLAAGMGLVAGLILSLAQWAVLRKHVNRAWQWLPANAIAWAVGMPIIFAGIDLAQRVGSTIGGVLVMALTITITGAAVGVVHGIALITLVEQKKLGTQL